MKTQNVMTQAANLFGSTAGSVTSKSNQKENDFGKLMSSSLKTSKDISCGHDKQVVKKTSDKTAMKQDHLKSESTSSADTKSNSVNDNQSAKTNAAKVSNQKSKDTSKDTTGVTKGEKEIKKQSDQTLSTDQQSLALIQGILEQIQQIVMDRLNLSSEELNKMLDSQGFTLADLLQPENLQQLILANSGQTDIMSTLTDEKLADSMKQLLQNLEEIKTDSKLGLTPEQMKALLDQLKAKMTEGSEISGSIEQIQSQTDTSKQMEVIASQSSMDTKDTTVNASQVANTVDEALSPAEVAAKVETGTQTKSNNDTGKNLNNPDGFQNFVDNVVKVSQNIQPEMNSDAARVTDLREIANQIIERIKVSVTSDHTSMELQLNPESLGKVNLSVHSKEGIITARFIVQNELSKEAIESQIQTLRETLNGQGVKIEAIEVTVSANAFQQNNFDESKNQTDMSENKSGKKISLDDAINMTETEGDQGSPEDITGIRGSLVDYTA